MDLLKRESSKPASHGQPGLTRPAAWPVGTRLLTAPGSSTTPGRLAPATIGVVLAPVLSAFVLSAFVLYAFAAVPPASARQEPPSAAQAARPALRSDDVERAIWLLDDLSLFFGSLAEQERNQHAREDWTTAQRNYEQAAGKLARLFGRGLIRIAALDPGIAVAVQGSLITLDRDLDGAWDGAGLAGRRGRGTDDWPQVSALSSHLLQALAPSHDLEKWRWFQTHLRRTPSITRSTVASDRAVAADIVGFGFLRDRYLLGAILAETAPRRALKTRWAARRDALSGEATRFFQIQAAKEGRGTKASLERQWKEFTDSSVQLSKSWTQRRTQPAAPSFGRVSDVDLPLLVQRAKRDENPLKRLAVTLPLDRYAGAPRVAAIPGTGETVSEPQARAGTDLRDERGSAASLYRQAAEGEASDAGPNRSTTSEGKTAGRSPSVRFPLPALSGLEEKREPKRPTASAGATAAALTVPETPLPPASESGPKALERPWPAPAAEDGAADQAPSAAEPEAEAVAVLPEEPSAQTVNTAALDGNSQASPDASPASQDGSGGTAIADSGTGQKPGSTASQASAGDTPGTTQVAAVPPITVPESLGPAAWLRNLGTAGLTALGLAGFAFFALSFLLIIWLRALFRSERIADSGDQQIIVVVETESGDRAPDHGTACLVAAPPVLGRPVTFDEAPAPAHPPESAAQEVGPRPEAPPETQAEPAGLPHDAEAVIETAVAAERSGEAATGNGAIVEPQQIEQALVALRDSQAVENGAADATAQGPFAAVVNPDRLEPRATAERPSAVSSEGDGRTALDALECESFPEDRSPDLASPEITSADPAPRAFGPESADLPSDWPAGTKDSFAGIEPDFDSAFDSGSPKAPPNGQGPLTDKATPMDKTPPMDKTMTLDEQDPGTPGFNEAESPGIGTPASRIELSDLEGDPPHDPEPRSEPCDGAEPAILDPPSDSLFKDIGNALRAGELERFQNRFQDLTALPTGRVERIVYSPGGEDFAVTCLALGIDKLDFASLFLLVRKQCHGESPVPPRRLSKVLALYDKVDANTARQLLKRWQADPDYPGVLDGLQAGETVLDDLEQHPNG